MRPTTPLLGAALCLLLASPATHATTDSVSGTVHTTLLVAADARAVLVAACDPEETMVTHLVVLGAGKKWKAVGRFTVGEDVDIEALAEACMDDAVIAHAELASEAPPKLKKLLTKYKLTLTPVAQAASPKGDAYALVTRGMKRTSIGLVEASGETHRAAWRNKGWPDGAGTLNAAWDPQGRIAIVSGSVVTKIKRGAFVATPVVKIWAPKKPGKGSFDSKLVAKRLVTFARIQTGFCDSQPDDPAGAAADFWCGLAVDALGQVAALGTADAKKRLTDAAKDKAFKTLANQGAFNKLWGKLP